MDATKLSVQEFKELRHSLYKAALARLEEVVKEESSTSYFICDLLNTSLNVRNFGLKCPDDFAEVLSFKPTTKYPHEIWWHEEDWEIRKEVLIKCIELTKPTDEELLSSSTTHEGSVSESSDNAAGGIIGRSEIGILATEHTDSSFPKNMDDGTSKPNKETIVSTEQQAEEGHQA